MWQKALCRCDHVNDLLMGRLLPHNYSAFKTGKWEVEEEVKVIPCRKGLPSLLGTGGRGKRQEPGDDDVGATEEQK